MDRSILVLPILGIVFVVTAFVGANVTSTGPVLQQQNFRDATGPKWQSIEAMATVTGGDPCDPIVQSFTFQGSSGIDYDFLVAQSPFAIAEVQIEVDVTASGTFTYFLNEPSNVDIAALWWLNGNTINAPFTSNLSEINLLAPSFPVNPFVTYIGEFDSCTIFAEDLGPCVTPLSTTGTGAGITNDTELYEGDGAVLITLDPTNWWSAQTGSGTVSLVGSDVDGVLHVRYFPCGGNTTSTCPADLNGDSNVDLDDLFIVVFDWGCVGACLGDVEGDGLVNVTDLQTLIRNWGPCEVD